MMRLLAQEKAQIPISGEVTNKTRRYFDIERDRTFSCFCEACLVGKDKSEASPDPRYCQGCYDFLVNEAEMVTGHTRTDWEPIKPPPESPTIEERSTQKLPHVPQVGGGIMSTLESGKFEVDIIKATIPSKVAGKRGPKHKTLPVDLIIQWVGEGIGSKAIAGKLKAEHEILVSYKTIQRVLSGQRA